MIVPSLKIFFYTKLSKHIMDEDIFKIFNNLSEEMYSDLNNIKTLEATRKMLNSQDIINMLCSEPYLKDYLLFYSLKMRDPLTDIVKADKLPKDYKTTN